MTPATAAATPPGLPRPAVLLVSLAAGFLVVSGLRGLSEIVGPVFLALVLVIATQPMRVAAVRRGVPGWVASIVALVLIYLGLLGFTLAMSLSVASFATLLPTYEDEANQMLDSVASWLTAQGFGEEQLQRAVSGLDLGRVVELAGSLASGLLEVVTGLFLVITLVLFMVADSARFSAKLRRLPQAHAPFVEALTSFGIATRRYLVVSTVFGLVVAALDTAALTMLGVPAALLWGLLAFITNYIPNIGFVIGLLPPAIIGLLEGGPRLMLYVVLVYCVLNVLIQSVLQPKIVGDAVGLSSTITMVSLVFWAYALGPVGALLAVPLSLFAKAVLVDADPRAQWLIPLISGAAPGKPAWKHSPGHASGAPKAPPEPKEPAGPPREEAR